MKMEIGDWVEVIEKEYANPDVGEVGIVVGQGSVHHGTEPFITAVEFGKNNVRHLQTKNLVVIRKDCFKTSLEQQKKVFDKMMKNSEEGIDLLSGLYYTTSKGRKPIKEITKHTFKIHSVKIEENEMKLYDEVVEKYTESCKEKASAISLSVIIKMTQEIMNLAESATDSYYHEFNISEAHEKIALDKVVKYFLDEGFTVSRTDECLNKCNEGVRISWELGPPKRTFDGLVVLASELMKMSVIEDVGILLNDDKRTLKWKYTKSDLSGFVGENASPEFIGMAYKEFNNALYGLKQNNYKGGIK